MAGRVETQQDRDDALSEYRRKRQPRGTPEPFAKVASGADSSRGIFVVQQHAARRLHWDLRLEVRGTLASWAVPRGPTFDPKERRLAVRTEDHPIEYADFEGIIPAGNYGAGAMIVWDRGSFETVDGQPASGAVDKGKFDAILAGCKLQGRFTLVQTKEAGGKHWLLLCKHSSRGVGDPVVSEPESVLSGLTVEELRDQVSRDAALREAAQRHGASAPARARPAAMHAETAEAAFADPAWGFEIKWDGARILARRRGSVVNLRYRSGRDATAAFPEIVAALEHLPCSQFTLDGEVVCLDATGVSRFELLQPRFADVDPRRAQRAAQQSPARFLAFDLLDIDDFDLTGLPLRARVDLLRQLLPPRGAMVRRSEMLGNDGAQLLEAVRAHGGEGIVGKRLESVYQPGRRSRDWLKIKLRPTADLVVIGYLPSERQSAGVASLLLAWWRDGHLTYAGNAGSGFNAEARVVARQALDPLRGAPCCPLPARGLRRAVCVDPRLVVEVSYQEVTSGGLLRAPVIERWRPDKLPAECLAPSQTAATPNPKPEIPQPEAPLEARRTVFTNVDKVFWPERRFTKGDLIEYYRGVWPWLQPYLKDRPLVLTRYPDGIAGKNFFQRNAPAFTPPWVETANIDDTDFFLCNDLDSLLYVANSACIPIHVWNARLGSLDQPDWCVLDLDPKSAPFDWVVRVAQEIHRLLDRLALPGFAKTSGQSGLHVMVPLSEQLSQSETKMFGELLAHAVVAACPDIATTARAISSRGDRVYVDFLQNGRGKTIVAPFSLRPVAAATASAPLAWQEVRRGLDPQRFDLRSMLPRLQKRGDEMTGLLVEHADILNALTVLTSELGLE